MEKYIYIYTYIYISLHTYVTRLCICIYIYIYIQVDYRDRSNSAGVEDHADVLEQYGFRWLFVEYFRHELLPINICC